MFELFIPLKAGRVNRIWTISIRVRNMLAYAVVPELLPPEAPFLITQFHGSLCMGRKKMYEQQRDQILGMQFNVDSLAGAQEQVGSRPDGRGNSIAGRRLE